MIHKLRLATDRYDSPASPVEHRGSQVPNNSDTLRFERRFTDRWPMNSAATAFRLGGERFGQMYELKVLDCSCEGLGAISPHPIEPGATVSIGFSTPGQTAKRGTVIRCAPCGDGYRVAIRYDARLAA